MERYFQRERRRTLQLVLPVGARRQRAQQRVHAARPGVRRRHYAPVAPRRIRVPAFAQPPLSGGDRLETATGK